MKSTYEFNFYVNGKIHREREYADTFEEVKKIIKKDYKGATKFFLISKTKSR